MRDGVLNRFTNETFDTDEEKIDEILRIVYVNLVNNTLNFCLIYCNILSFHSHSINFFLHILKF